MRLHGMGLGWMLGTNLLNNTSTDVADDVATSELGCSNVVTMQHKKLNQSKRKMNE